MVDDAARTVHERLRLLDDELPEITQGELAVMFARTRSEPAARPARRFRRRAALVVVLAAVVVTGAVAWAANSARSVGVFNTTTISGGTAADRALLRSITTHLDGRLFRSERFTVPPPVFRSTTHSGWLALRADGTRAQGNSLATWESVLLAGAYIDQAPSHGADQIGGGSARFINIAGRQTRHGVGGYDMRLGQTGKRPAYTDQSTARAEIADAIATYGWKLSSIRILTPDGIAPVVVAIAPASSKTPLVPQVLGAHAFAWDGWYLRVIDAAGKPLLVNAYSARTRFGASWTGTSKQARELNPNAPSPTR